MSSRLPRDEALETEDGIDEMKNIKNSPSVPHLLQAQQAPAHPYAKVVGHPDTGSYPAPSSDSTTHNICCGFSLELPHLLSIHNICFYRETWKIISKLSSNTHIIRFSGKAAQKMKNEEEQLSLISCQQN